MCKESESSKLSSYGASGEELSCRDPLVMAAVDGHMHIQSGHVGTIPFALGAKIPFSVREATLDTAIEVLSSVLDRKLLDEGVTRLYENGLQPFMKDLAAKADVLAGKADSLSGTIEEKKKKIQHLIYSGALKIGKVIEKAFLTYEKSIDQDYRSIVDQMSRNLKNIEEALDRGEFATSSVSSGIHQEREVLHDVNDRIQEKAGMLTGLCIGIATFIVDFQLSLIENIYAAVAGALSNIREKAKQFADAVLEVFGNITALRKNIAKVICWDIIQTIMESAKELDEYVDKQGNRAQAAATALHTQLEELEKYFNAHSSVAMGQFLGVQKKKTYEIAGVAVDGHAASMVERAKEAGCEPDNVFGPIIAMPMDLDYAQIDRFEDDDVKAKVYRYCTKRYWMHVDTPTVLPIMPVRPVTMLPHTTPSKILLEPEMADERLELIRKFTIVEEEAGSFYYFHSRLSGVKPGKLFWVNKQEYKIYEYWKIQLKHTVKSALENPWRIVPLYHFEPRRYSTGCEEAFQYIMHKNSSAGSSKEPRVFIGFKVYPNLGYKPLDLRLPALEKMYSFCCENEVPIMTHGSPNGAYTHDRPIYYEYDQKAMDPTKRSTATIPVPELNSMHHGSKELFYFMQEYASPYAWEKVLAKHKKLRLCIAHFGGSDDRPDSTDKKPVPLSGWNVPIDPNLPDRENWDTRYWNQKIIDMIQRYDNLYTDLSCHTMKPDIIQNLAYAIVRWPDLRKRILFGTDWYMTEIGGLSYPAFVAQMKNAIDTIDDLVRANGVLPVDDPPLWQWMTEINPFRFYRFDRIAKEYSNELKRSINSDGGSDDEKLCIILNRIEKYKKNIFLIAKKMKKFGELPDAKTSD